MVIVGLALLGAFIVTAILVVARLALSRQRNDWQRTVLPWASALFVINFIVDLLIFYFAMPALTGPYGGWQWLIWPLLLSGTISILLSGAAAGARIAGGIAQNPLFRRRVVTPDPPSWRMLMAEGSGAAGLIAVVLAILFAFVINSVIVISTTWFDPNAKALASIAGIQMSTAATLPPTNVQHIVLVTQDVAAYRGQQVLAQNGQNFGSIYHLENAQYTLQSVAGHLYWIAPLVYNNVWANLGNYNTPGFVVVDAENPDAPAMLKTGYHLHYVPGALFNQDLIRHVYLSGYTYGDLTDPTLEVDDNFQPYYTISVMQPSRGFTGGKLYQVLLVDPQSGKIQVFAPDKVPAWVDRVIPSSVVTDYLNWWGDYHSAPWFNPSGAGQQIPATDPELVYNDVNQPVWLVPMTSSSAKDNSSTGVVLFDTKKNAATFYPLAGLGVGDNVKSAFASNPANIRAYEVSTPQLYYIYGRPTWVATFTQANSSGATFQAVGLVAADDLNGANVQMAPTRDAALTLYSQWLAGHSKGSSGNGGPTSTGTPGSQMSGKVIRVAPTTVGGSTVYYLWVAGEAHIFTASLAISPLLPLVQPGDQVSGTYLDTGQQVVSLTSFTDTSITLPTPTPAPTTGP